MFDKFIELWKNRGEQRAVDLCLPYGWTEE
jgi:hypothetical protein